MIQTLAIEVKGKGLLEITAEVNAVVKASGFRFGLCTLFLQHTSASLLIQENADPAVRRDLERWLNRLVPEGDALYTHTEEGADDMPAHIKTALTAVSLSIPVVDWALALGRWQGIFLWEHRRFASQRHLVVHLAS
jgi:secondary thiamine-phosphate synthase enzyme